MKYKVVLSDQAILDVRMIYEYIAFEKQAPETASGFIDRLEKQILKLDEMPYRFREYDRELWRSRGLRIMPVENFIAFYIPEDENKTVTVIRILYCGQDVHKHLNKTD